jgi:integrase
MPHLSPQTLTEAEQRRLRRATAANPRDHLIFSMALGTGLRLAELVGLDVGDVFFPGGAPKGRVRLRREIAKRHRAGDVFLPDALGPKMRRFWRYKRLRRESLAPEAPLFCSHRGDAHRKARRFDRAERGWAGAG